MPLKARFLIVFATALICADAQTTSDEGHIPITNGLWHLHKVGTDQNRTRKWNNDDEFRLCVGDGGKFVPFLIDRLGPDTVFNRNANIRVRVTGKDSESVEVDAQDLHDDLAMKITFISPVKASAEGMENTSEGTWSVHMDLDYEGADCGDILPGHSRAKVFGQWR